MSEHITSEQTSAEQASPEQASPEQAAAELSAAQSLVPEQRLSEQKDAINQQIAEAQQELRGFEQALAAVDAELAGLAEQRWQYDLLQQAVDAVQRLEDEGAAQLFWGDKLAAGDGVAHLGDLSQRVNAFHDQVQRIVERREGVLRDIGGQQDQIGFLAEDLFDLEREEESRRQEWVIEREEGELPTLSRIMPWMRGFEDDKRFRKTLLASLCACLLLGLIIPLIDIPIPERDELIEVPERFVQLIQQQEQKPLPPPRPQLEQPEETKPPEPELEKVAEEKPKEAQQKIAEKPAPAVAKQKSARERVATKGILAFRESFSNLANSRPSAKLGAKARINNAGQQASGRPQRNMVTTQAMGSSGGINLASISRDVGDGGGGGAMAGVQTTQVESSIAGPGGSDRPLSAGAAAGRTDEEIQIVFDRYKAALYRLYNRELRKDPTLRGQLVLQLTIEPDGTVSLCRLQGSTMDAPALAQQVVDRVSNFNFGAKDVPAITIVYPIDFLPAS